MIPLFSSRAARKRCDELTIRSEEDQDEGAGGRQRKRQTIQRKQESITFPSLIQYRKYCIPVTWKDADQFDQASKMAAICNYADKKFLPISEMYRKKTRYDHLMPPLS